REPAVHPEIHVALGHRLIEGRVVEGGDGRNLVAEFLQQLAVDLGVEPAGIPGGLRHVDGDAFAGLVLGDRGDGHRGGQQRGRESGKGFAETEHCVFVSLFSLRIRGARTGATKNDAEGVLLRNGHQPAFPISAVACGRSRKKETSAWRSDPVRAPFCAARPWVVRSGTIARMTMPTPPAVAPPTSSRPSPVLTTRPRPPAPISAAITTMDRASISVWLSPAMMVRRASGNWTSTSICQEVDPKASAASIRSPRTLRIPRFVSRMIGGKAKMMVAMMPGAIPTPNSMTIGTR